MKKKKQKQPQEVKVKVRQKASILSIIKFILGIAFIALIVFFLLGILSSCDSRIKVPWSGWFNNPFGIFETDNENPDLPSEDEGDGDGEITQYTVTFYAYEGNVTHVTVAEGETVGDKMPPTPVQDGYTFDGWWVDDTEFTKDTVVSSDLFVSAHWEPVPCEHSFVLKPDTVGGEDAYGHTLTVYQCTKCGEDLTWVNHVYYLDPEYSGDETDEYGHPLVLYVCSLCGESYTRVLHSYSDGVCTVCGEEQCEHEFVDGVCTKCGAFEQEFNDETNPDEPDEPDDKPCDDHVDADGDGSCDNCGAAVTPDEPCTDHVDENDDGKCDNCGEDMPDEPTPPHVHTFSEEWTSDESGHWHAATCEHKDEISGFASHDFVSGVCSVCGYAAPHEHTFSDEWTSDKSGHWHAATCEHTGVTSGFASHEWDGGEVVKEPTCTAEGERLYTCTVCGYERTESIATTAHDLSYTYDENGHWQECADCDYTTSSEPHNFVSETCTVCGYVAPHEHTFSDEWTSDESGHWHAATCGHDVTGSFAAHKWDSGQTVTEATCTAEGEMLYTCTVCGYERTESIPKAEHDLSYVSDENGHWQECANCDYETPSVPHEFEDGECTVCGQESNCTEHVDEDKDGHCDNCDEWLLSDPEDTYDGVSGASEIYDEFIHDDSFGYVYDYVGGGGAELPYDYPYPDDKSIMLTEHPTGEYLKEDYKIIFAFDYSVLMYFEEIAASIVISRSGNTVEFDINMNDMLFKDYYGFSDARFICYGLGGMTGSYEVDGSYGTHIFGEFTLPSAFWSTPDAYAVCRIYMGVNIRVAAEEHSMLNISGPEEAASDVTLFLRGPNLRDELVLYVAVPGGYQITSVGLSNFPRVKYTESPVRSYGYYFFEVTGDPWGSSIDIEFTYTEFPSSENQTQFDIEVDYWEAEGIVCIAMYNELQNTVTIQFYTLPEFHGQREITDVLITCSEGDSLVTVERLFFTDDYRESGYITFSCDYWELCTFGIQFVF